MLLNDVHRRFFYYSFGEQGGALLLLMSECRNGVQTVEW